jgi:putative spermidine/putrescine transport system permease protein
MTDDAIRPRRLRLPNRNWLLVVPALALMAFVLLVPIAQSLYRSFTDPSLGFDNYTALFTDGITLLVLGRTALVALVVTVCTLVIGYPYAYLMTRAGPRARAALLVVVLIPFWTSVMARNFAWIVLLQRDGPVNRLFAVLGMPDVVFYGTGAGVAIAMTQVMLPFMVLPLFSTLGAIDRRLLLAARGLGSSPVVAFWRVFFPLSRGGVVSGLILVFTLSLGFYVTPALVGSPQQSLVAQLLGQRTSQLLDFGGAGALGAVILVVTLALVAWANRLGGTMSAIGVVSSETEGRR